MIIQPTTKFLSGMFLSATLVGMFLFTGGVAAADPPGNSPDDPVNGRRFCAIVDKNPTVEGLVDAIPQLSEAGLGADALSDAVAYGILYICPQYAPQFEEAFTRFGQSPKG